jgi:hypothetical protein
LAFLLSGAGEVGVARSFQLLLVVLVSLDKALDGMAAEKSILSFARICGTIVAQIKV